MIRECRHCQVSFDTNEPRKIKIGGYLNECADCVEERGGDKSPPRYLGLQSGNGKMSDVTILRFKDEASREAYHKMWQVNSGYYKGKSCQIGHGLMSSAGYNFELVAENLGNENHKGRS